MVTMLLNLYNSCITRCLTWRVFFISVFGLVSAFSALNYSFEILPIGGSTFETCFFTVWLISSVVHTILLYKVILDYPKDFELFREQKKIKTTNLEPNPEAVKKLAEDIDKYFIKKWYQYISENNEFTLESNIVLEEVLHRLFKVLIHVNKKVLIHGILNIYLKHLKEFRRTLKRKEKYGGQIQDLYKYSHVCVGSQKSLKYYLHQLTTNVLNQFINWELWNSLPCHALVAIVSRKFTAYMLNLLSCPHFLNYQFIKVLGSKSVKNVLDLPKYSKVCLQDCCFNDCLKQDYDQQNEEEEEENQDVVDSKPENKSECVTKPEIISVDKPAIKKSEPVLKSDPVKIHEPKGTSKVWNDSQDLISVSFGMDPLSSFMAEDKVSYKNTEDVKLGKAEECLESPTSATNMFLNEVKQMTSMEGLKSSIKPISEATVNTLSNFKDLQESTVNNALTKIGDFQDEAAGVVEGLLDFGRAGLRKGLRLTGLQDNIQNAKAVLTSTTAPKLKTKATKLVHSDSTEKTSSGDSTESCWINPLQSTDTPNYDGQILLEKGKPADDFEKSVEDHPIIPYISTESEDSPDPEYEEPADLESTIAKLRSLLQQKSSESNLSTPAISPMPPDDFCMKMSQDATGDLEVDGMVPSFYKLCAKTATGVFNKSLNTIKTALPGNTSDQFLNTENWKFEAVKETDNDFLLRVKKLLAERKEFCKVDTAYEAIDSLDPISQLTDSNVNVQFEDELDEFEVKLPVTKAIIGIICELLADTESLLIQESLVKAIVLSFGNTIENRIVSQTENFINNLCANLFRIPETTINQTLDMNLESYISAILSSFPDYMVIIFSQQNLERAIRLFVMSLQTEKINEDIFLQIFELISMKLIEESQLPLGPPASA
ncbi:uncharacterized protein LOC109595505 isoform X2 [Aethina tumida]|uniref:uncharacterized protein LOC109595505 isoform X2 n=1 Tax=Aethina tumida TaxID=116153 RepID=UPI002147AACF|nr:uncharacterized protein LOC109595505 isoform X2 [Aethina tumida]